MQLLKDINYKKVITNRGEYLANNVIIATGTKPKYLGLDNEKDLLGRGISTCATCDGAFYKDKEVAVVGSGNSALQESLYLANICSKVYILNKKTGFKGEDILVEKGYTKTSLGTDVLRTETVPLMIASIVKYLKECGNNGKI